MGRYVPPDVEGTTSGNRLHKKHPLGSRASKPGSLTVRFELPYAIWCSTCPKPTIIGQGVRFNAAKRRVGAYHTTPIWAFRFRHTECGGEIEIRTDPQNTAYVVTEGATKRDTGDDVAKEGDTVVLTDQEREALRQNAFAKLEKTIEDREQLKQAKERIDDLEEASARHWDDPYTQNQKLRKLFRAGRKERERDAAATENLQDRMSLGIDLLPSTEEDSRRAALVDFGPSTTHDKALSKPLFKVAETSSENSSKPLLKADKEAAKRKDVMVSEFLSNTRTAKDPFLNDTRGEGKGSVRLPGVKRKRPVQDAGPEPEVSRTTSKLLVNYDSE